MDSDIKSLGKTIVNLNLLLTNKIEGFDFDEKHKDVKLDAEFKILHLLYNYGRLTPIELVNKLYIAKSNLSNACKNMMKKGLINQFGDKTDRRVVCYSICDAGREVYEDTIKTVIKNLNDLVGEADIEDFLEYIRKIGQIINN